MIYPISIETDTTCKFTEVQAPNPEDWWSLQDAHKPHYAQHQEWEVFSEIPVTYC